VLRKISLVLLILGKLDHFINENILFHCSVIV
jgi:hypothetical protein